MAADAQRAAHTLRLRESRAREARERRARAAREELDRRLAACLPGRGAAWLIGSLAWGGFGTRSDIDVVAEGLSEAEAAALERSLGVIEGAAVEVLRLEELPAAFQERVTREGIRLGGG
ncbi:MAG: nucleotidyltransferase domain-containing protein [Sandaracinaceae bacterium]|nr:nucleotidyltransferase domain-containing protein [Sandaracinaceae bacterium]